MPISQWDSTCITQEIFESPKIIGGSKFGLGGNLANNQQLFDYLSPRKKHVDSYQGAPIYTAENYFFTLRGDQLTYVVRHETTKLPVDQRAVTQIFVWRSPGLAPTHIASYVFWNHLFPLHHAILTDSSQTPDGRRFWGDRVGDAHRKNLLVYILDLETNRATPIPNPESFSGIAQQAYGHADRHKNLRLLIARDPVQGFRVVEGGRRIVLPL